MTTNFEQDETAMISTKFSMPLGFPSLEGKSFAERNRLAVAVGKFRQASMSLELFYGKVLELRGVIQHPATLTDMQTGEVKAVTRTVFLTEQGDCIASVSAAVDRAVQEFYALFGEPELGVWEGSFRVLVSAQKTRSGNNTFALAVVE